MLLELAGQSAAGASIIADEENNELLISGPPQLHALAKQLLQQLSTSDGSAEPTPRTTGQITSPPRTSAPRTDPSEPSPAPALPPAKRRTAGNSTRTIHLQALSTEEATDSLTAILGDRLQQVGSQLVLQHSRNRRASLLLSSRNNSVTISGDPQLSEQLNRLLLQLDAARDSDISDTIHFVNLASMEPDVVKRAVQLWQQAATQQQRPEQGGRKAAPQPRTDPSSDTENENPIPDQGSNRNSRRPLKMVSFGKQDSATDPAAVAPPAAEPGIDETAERPSLRRPSGDVEVEALPDLDVMILRGRDPDVEELANIIQEIERLSAETTPEIEIVYLQHVRGENLNELIDDVLEDLTGPLQGRVVLTPLIKPNALLLVGWGEAVKAAKTLALRLDEAVVPETQLEVFRLKHAAAAVVEATITEFLDNRGGLGADVKITADNRTNSLLVNAAPRDLAEVRLLIQQLDAESGESVNQIRIVVLKNSLAADVSTTVNAALVAARGGGSGGAAAAPRNAALEMLLTQPDGSQMAASGMLEEVRITADARSNRLFLTGPPQGLDLVEELIRLLDETPAAAAQIKVFQVTNGDASELVLVLRSLFPEAGISTVPQLASAEGETALVPVRFSVDIRTNSIIATGSSGDLKIIEVLLLRLDEAGTQERINKVLRLKNSPALDVANAVNNFLRSERTVTLAAPGRQNPFAQIESEVVVVPEPVGNALIISATPRYFDQILELVEGLDAQPPQVMIQVILAEVELDNLQEFGVELGLQDSLLFDRSVLGSVVAPATAEMRPGFNFNNQQLGNSGSAASMAGAGKVGGQALSHFSLGRTNSETEYGGLVLSASSENISVLLRAMNQSRTMEILSRPQIMTLDNQPAFIQVGERVPRITGTSINQVGQVNSVALENVGLILGVTPRISPEGMVVMEIDAEKSDVGPEIEGIPVSVSSQGEVIRSPRVNITTAQTTVSAASGQTIVIGGLITTDNRTVSRRVPFLSDIPVLGHLFRYDSGSNNRRELLIILTPHVVRGPEEAELLKQMEMSRMSWISSDIFDWMNPQMPISSRMDGDNVPTIFPDKTPGVDSLPAIDNQPAPVSPQSEVPAPPPAETPDQSQTTARQGIRAVVPEWKIETKTAEDPASPVRRLSWTKPRNAPAKPASRNNQTPKRRSP
jgi:type II secretion system protein D